MLEICETSWGRTYGLFGWGLLALICLAVLFVWQEVAEFSRMVGSASFEPYLGGAALVWLGMMAVASVLLLLAIRKDRPFGTKVFWMTRPIGKGVVLASKLIVLLAIGSILLAAYLVPPVLSGSGSETLLLQLSGRFFMLSVPVFFAVATFGLVSAGLPGFSMVSALFLTLFILVPMGRPLDGVAIPESRMMVGAIAVVVGGVGLFGIQYWFRSRALGMGLMVVLWVITAFLVAGWSRDVFAAPVLKTDEEDSLGLNRVQLELSILSFLKASQRTTGGGIGISSRSLSTNGVLSDWPGGLGIPGYLAIDGEIVPADRGEPFSVRSERSLTAIPGPSSLSSSVVSSNYRFLGPIEVPGEQWASVGDFGLGKVWFASVKESDFGLLRNRDLAFEGTAFFEISKPLLVGEVPVWQQGRMEAMGVHFTVVSKVDSDGQFWVHVNSVWWSPALFGHRSEFARFRVLLVNHEAKEWTLLRGHGSLRSSGIWRIGMGDQRFRLSQSIQEDWLEEGMIVITVEESQGVVKRPVRIDSFRVSEEP